MKKIYFKYFILMSLCFIWVSTGLAAQDKTSENAQSTSSPDSASALSPDSIETYSRPAYDYNSKGRRDPFESLMPEKIDAEKVIKGLFNYEGAKILGVAVSGSDNYALVVDAANASYVLRPGQKVLGGFVSHITDEGIFLHIVKYGRAMTIKMRLESSKLTVIEEDIDGGKTIRRPGINMSYDEKPLGRKEVGIEDVSVPSLNTKTVEEIWFGKKRDVTDFVEERLSLADSVEGEFYLIEPPDNSWIKLPCEIQWTGVENKTVTYSITIDNDSDFSSPLIDREGLTSSTFVIDNDLNIPVNTLIYWQVYATDQSGNKIFPLQKLMSFRIAGDK
jgi:hypothetical protein